MNYTQAPKVIFIIHWFKGLSSLLYNLYLIKPKPTISTNTTTTTTTTPTTNNTTISITKNSLSIMNLRATSLMCNLFYQMKKEIYLKGFIWIRSNYLLLLQNLLNKLYQISCKFLIIYFIFNCLN